MSASEMRTYVGESLRDSYQTAFELRMSTWESWTYGLLHSLAATAHSPEASEGVRTGSFFSEPVVRRIFPLIGQRFPAFVG